MKGIEEKKLTRSESGLLERLRRERVLWDPSSSTELDTLREEVARIAADMDHPSRPPRMYWTGIPWPEVVSEPSCDYNLVISLGGTKTDFALLRLDRGKIYYLDLRTGEETSDAEKIHAAKTASELETPSEADGTQTGEEMIAKIVRHIAGHLRPHARALGRCESILLSWGFPHRVVRTGPRLAGGLSARVTLMTKGQEPFTEDLLQKDVGALFERHFRSELAWFRPIAVANDTVMALHWFLAPDRRAGHERIGLFINGTGTNFSAAEPYAVREAGFLSRAGEDYCPERITGARPLRPGEAEALFFVNYEAGGTELGATRTRFDTEVEYPLERNALAGGNAFGQMLEAFTKEWISEKVYERLSTNWSEMAREKEEKRPTGMTVSALVEGKDERLFLGLQTDEIARLRLTARAIAERSALHAALVLAAITQRSGFGRGRGGRPDLLGMEGSVWKTPGYPALVRSYWQDLAGKEELFLDLAHEENFNASLSGPLYLAAIHRQP